MALTELSCVDCGQPTEKALVDAKGRSTATCTRCIGGRVDELADHARSMSRVDYRGCPICGSEDGLPIPVDRDRGRLVISGGTMRGGGVTRCQRCRAAVPWGVSNP